jgi:hypothetical protein
MSWDVSLSCDSCHHTIGDWNYTSNITPMLSIARGAYEGSSGPIKWSTDLDGATGPEGKKIIDGIIKDLESAPTYYRSLNPKNGWGDYDSILETLKEMSAAVPEAPTHWWKS